MHGRAEKVEPGGNKIHHRPCPGENRLEHDEKDPEQQRKPGDRMQQNGIDPGC